MDFAEQFRRQLKFLRTSCDAYDEGDKDEAIRIATTVRTLCHQTSKSSSLFSHLKATDVRVLSTGEIVPPGRKFWPNLTVIRLSPQLGIAEFAPKLDAANTKRSIRLNEWWRGDPAYILDAREISRRELVLGAANKDGGAHVDVALDPTYERLLAGAGARMTTTTVAGSREMPFRFGHLAALRQIGFELLNSPEVLALAGGVLPEASC